MIVLLQSDSSLSHNAALCTAVTERASEGPCEHVVHEKLSSWVCSFSAEGHKTYVHHAYLGPVLARCGHEESDHVTDDFRGFARTHCRRCFWETEGVDIHAFTDAG